MKRIFYFAALLLCEKFISKKIKDRVPKFISHIYLIFAVLIGFVIFNANGISGVGEDLRGMFTSAYPVSNGITLYYLRSYAVLLITAAIGSTPALKTICNKIKGNRIGEKILNVAEPFFVAAVLIIVTAYLIDGTYNPFLYFRF